MSNDLTTPLVLMQFWIGLPRYYRGEKSVFNFIFKILEAMSGGFLLKKMCVASNSLAHFSTHKLCIEISTRDLFIAYLQGLRAPSSRFMPRLIQLQRNARSQTTSVSTDLLHTKRSSSPKLQHVKGGTWLLSISLNGNLANTSKPRKQKRLWAN